MIYAWNIFFVFYKCNVSGSTILCAMWTPLSRCCPKKSCTRLHWTSVSVTTVSLGGSRWSGSTLSSHWRSIGVTLYLLGKTRLKLQVASLVLTYTVESALKDYPIGHKNMVFQDRWSLVTGSVALKCRLSARSMWSFKTGGLSWQWSLKTGFPVYTGPVYTAVSTLRPLMWPWKYPITKISRKWVESERNSSLMR